MVCLLISLLFAMAECQKSLSPDGTCGVVDLLETRVVGGDNISAEYAPWNVILERKAKATPEKIVTHCGGNIITPSFVLTAAHCIWGKVKIRNPEELNVYVGKSSIRPKNEAIRLERIIPHEKWYKTLSLKQNVKFGHDIALLQLEKELVFSDTIQPICLPNSNTAISTGTPVTINGYGLIRKNPTERAEHLQTGDMEIWDKTACISSWSGLIEGDQLCALGDGVDSCTGDSGSGLTVNQPGVGRSSIAVLVGLTSFGSRSCNTTYLPGVYTNVLSHVDWIEKKILGISNQNIISRTPSSCNIAIFTKSYIRGDHQTFTEDQENLGAWDNKLVSLKVNGECCWRVFTEVNYGGNSKDFCERAYNRATDIGFLFKSASSLKLIM